VAKVGESRNGENKIPQRSGNKTQAIGPNHAQKKGNTKIKWSHCPRNSGE